MAAARSRFRIKLSKSRFNICTLLEIAAIFQWKIADADDRALFRPRGSPAARWNFARLRGVGV